MPTTSEKLLQATRTLPEPLLAEVLNFAELLKAKRRMADSEDQSQSLVALSGGLENSQTFIEDPLTIQRQLRHEWH